METKLFPYKDKYPSIAPDVFIAPGAKIIGDVEILEGSSVWYNVVIRGDVNYVKIGKNTNIQDGSVLHVTNRKFPLIIENNVTVGHAAVLHGAILKKNSFVGMGAILLDGATLEPDSMVAAGSLVKQGFVVPSGKLVAGVPAKIIRDLTDEEIETIRQSALNYAEYARISAESLKNNDRV
ncbi:CysE/LacA/LpxA/NodL family acetyltransferase [Melioribacter roseus P3M-2]|uniref:CysE/LacA/LpxA/NodL family acetyltransferase n=1 Tax=Melioribacter roseus (strain DSM 23840 / JCM 17771 / VKM B-2668 / P3M-2) TaxID=1191523 RepID=I6YYW8_MELRP|nr:gamma carbonic anhydrase family protein [Melioribacter roseus]AFN75777.1 CysE/LacA/LpxA/NodL family acetyltransferase [Melioribacter roseus P3M-2]